MRRTIRSVLAFAPRALQALAAAACLAACGGGGGEAPPPVATPGVGTIGSQGGSVEPLSNGATVAVPAGALSASTTISIQQSGTAPNGSPRYTFGPSGTTFVTPAKVRLPVPAGLASPVLYWSKPGSTTSFDVVGGQVVGGMLEAPVQHFSVGFVGAACVQGEACTPATACREAALDCASGVPACAETGNLPDGTTCGAGLTCSGGACVAPAQPPSGLTYAANPAAYTVGQAIAANRPSHAGGPVTGYTVAPPLPPGLLLDPASGVISGTPSDLAARADYVVTASNAAGSTTATLSIAVNAPPPAELAYAVNPAVYATGAPITPNQAGGTGGQVVSWSVAPPLPIGLALNPATGVVSGTPTAITPAAAYLVTATNSGGTARVTLVITVTAPAPTGLAYTASTATYTVGTPIAPNAPSSGGGPVDGYAVAPPLPAGLALDQSTGLITGTPTAITPRATYLVTATNTGGTASATLILTVVAAPPTGLTYATNPAVYRVGTPISPNTPSSGGGAVVSYSIAPALPAGLTLGGATGIISGTPSSASPATAYVVTARNTGGSTTATVSILVVPLPPANLAYARNPVSATVGIASAPNATSHTGGAADLFTVVPHLPAGLTLDPATGAIGGTAAAPSPRQDYLVTASNAGGSTSAALTLTVRPATTLSAGFGHTCAVVNGAAWCWGAGEYGQLGSDALPRCVPANGYPADWPCASAPIPVTGLGSGVQAIAAGGFHSCALVDGGVWCWGLNHLGQLGNTGTALCDNVVQGPVPCSHVPVPVTGMSSGVEAIVAGGYFTCALRAGRLWCWGDDTWGTLGNEVASKCIVGNRETTCSFVPVEVAGVGGDAELVEAGFLHACVVKGGGLWCWGDDTWGELGHGTPVSICGLTPCSPVPVAVAGLASGVVAVAPGQFHSCAMAGGGARCWGNGLFGKLGDGATTDRPTPVQVSGLTAGVEALGTGDAHSCAIVNGGLRCWGDASNYGMLGNGGFSASPLPVDVLGLTSGGQAMAVGNYHTCAVVNGGIRCWGLNDFGQLGNGTTVTSPVPVPVSGPVGGGP